MLRQRLRFGGGGGDETPLSSRWTPSRDLRDPPIFSEWKLALFGLVISLLVISAKLYGANHEYIKKVVTEPRLVSYRVLTENGEEMFEYSWKTAVRYSSVWLPLLCGLLATHFTWMMVYLDSHVPGQQPPSPFSPDKYKNRSGHSFHLNYVFAVLIGVLLAGYMYWKEVSIQY